MAPWANTELDSYHNGLAAPDGGMGARSFEFEGPEELTPSSPEQFDMFTPNGEPLSDDAGGFGAPTPNGEYVPTGPEPSEIPSLVEE
jgi:hypothetical protein